MTKRLGRASAADIFWPLVVHYDALCSFYPRLVLLVLQRVFAWPNFSLLPNGFDAPFDGIFHKGEYFIRGYTFATSMDRGNPTLRSYAKKDQDRTNTPSNRTRNDRTKYPWNEDSSEDKKIERNAIHGSARGKRCHRSSTNQDTYFGRN